MTFEEFQDQVRIVGTPIEGTMQEHERGGLCDPTRFWLHTVGMKALGLPELEMYEVPGAFITDAARRLNHWGYYALGNKLTAGEVIQEGDSAMDPFFEVVDSPLPYWLEVGASCLRIQLGAVPVVCACCGEALREEEEEAAHSKRLLH